MDERQDERIDEQAEGPQERRRFGGGAQGRIWAGLFLLLVGGVLLLDQMGFPLPDWLFSWHILLIAIGLFLGLRHNFRGGAWLILILVGGCYLIQDFYPKTELKGFIAPCILIFIGFIIIFRPKQRWRQHPWKEEWKDNFRRRYEQEWKQHEWQHKHWQQKNWNPKWTPPGSVNYNNPNPETAAGQPNAQPNPGEQQNAYTSEQQNAYAKEQQNAYTGEDYIDSTSIFSGVHKKVVSKNFRGGDIVTFLGGSEIDLRQAEIIGTARLDVTQVMGGTKIIVPSHWEVRSEVTALFAGFEDKRQQPTVVNPDKLLIIDGTSIFGGIELKNY